MDLDGLQRTLAALRDGVDRHITPDRVRRYVAALSDTPAPSSFAGPMRVPVLRRLLREDGAFAAPLHIEADFRRTGSPVLLTGDRQAAKPLWYFAHLDTISYLVQPFDGARYPLVPFCVHMIQNGGRAARAYRFDLQVNALTPIAEGVLESEDGVPWFRPELGAPLLRPGDRVAMTSAFRMEDASGLFSGSTDNAGGVAALALAAPVLADAGYEAMLAFPDEEEGPVAPGNHMIGRGSRRIIDGLAPPDLAVVADVQQAGGDPDADTRGGIPNSARLGGGALLAEFSSFARGAVTPPDLYAVARHAAGLLGPFGVDIQESNNAYSSRSDDVSLMLKTPNILHLGFPGFNRHHDRGLPRAHLDDIRHLAKALVHMAAVRPLVVARRRALLER